MRHFQPATDSGSNGKTTARKKPKGQVVITEERCKGCGLCTTFCPADVLELSSAFNAKGYHPPEVVAPEKCTGCTLCGLYCPDFAIYGVKI